MLGGKRRRETTEEGRRERKGDLQLLLEVKRDGINGRIEWLRRKDGDRPVEEVAAAEDDVPQVAADGHRVAVSFQLGAK